MSKITFYVKVLIVLLLTKLISASEKDETKRYEVFHIVKSNFKSKKVLDA